MLVWFTELLGLFEQTSAVWSGGCFATAAPRWATVKSSIGGLGSYHTHGVNVDV
jgi:hypothetical protein